MKTYISLLFIFICSLSFGQKKIIKGKVLDSVTKVQIPYAIITIFNADKIIDGTSTDKFGDFSIQLNTQATHLKISFIGYDLSTINLNNFTFIEANIFYLKPALNALDEVIINAEQSTTSLKIDRKIINIGADLQQAGATALEAFDQVAEIQTDLGTGTLSLRGSGNVRLLINGKPSGLNPTELLEQLPASSILRVEIITSPSAKNLADGLSGIINVILKKNSLNGLNVNINGGFGTKRYNYGLNGNYSLGFINFRWNLSQAGRKMDSKQTIFQRYTNGNTRDFFAPHDFNGLVKTISTGIDFFY
ncbi:carboxypeptidase-like regulatory domain-containing protein [Polaribacter porphyrae]|uniref:TonB-dependent receptor plug domain-containing protein n=1 Tax=Polaribacter porphyrae TaxID=1137780 RepID=A0A2S7WSS6_9FLAO|nr:carboxypeptidase-like regulatory domain-containing protein [Polaribacter porphyrae]PQJ80361.1 hypothetical protein BTO18_14780 [Polaribacter porphyrae]